MNLTRFELEVMDVIWQRGEASVREIQEALADRSPAYTTVQTIVLRLEQKEALRRARKSGNAFVFAPRITKKSIVRRLVDDLLDLVGGSSQPLVAHLVERGKLTIDDIKAIESAAPAPKKRGRK
jgi:predicted transcriptional regulator